MAAARRVCMRQFIDQNELRASFQDGVEVHLRQAVAFVFDLAPGDDLQALQQNLGLLPPVRLDDTDHEIGTLSPFRLGRQQHLVRLADARRGTEENP